MAVSKQDISSTYPLPVYNYRVEIGSEAVAFSEVSGLGIGYETSTYKESQTVSNQSGPRTLYMPSQLTSTTLTLKKGVVPAVSIKSFYNWIKTVQINQVEKKDIRISLCNETGEAVITWTAINAFPTKLDAPSFDATSNDVAIESMELMADRVEIAEA